MVEIVENLYYNWDKLNSKRKINAYIEYIKLNNLFEIMIKRIQMATL